MLKLIVVFSSSVDWIIGHETPGKCYRIFFVQCAKPEGQKYIEERKVVFPIELERQKSVVKRNVVFLIKLERPKSVVKKKVVFLIKLERHKSVVEKKVVFLIKLKELKSIMRESDHSARRCGSSKPTWKAKRL